MAAWRTVLQESAEGLHAVAERPALRALAGVAVLLALGMSMAGTSYTIFVVRDLALPTGELGMIFALGGLGAVLGASLAPRLGRRFGSARTDALRPGGRGPGRRLRADGRRGSWSRRLGDAGLAGGRHAADGGGAADAATGATALGASGRA